VPCLVGFEVWIECWWSCGESNSSPKPRYS